MTFALQAECSVVLNIVLLAKLLHNAIIVEKSANRKVENCVDGKIQELINVAIKKTVLLT